MPLFSDRWGYIQAKTHYIYYKTLERAEWNSLDCAVGLPCDGPIQLNLPWMVLCMIEPECPLTVRNGGGDPHHPLTNTPHADHDRFATNKKKKGLFVQQKIVNRSSRKAVVFERIFLSSIEHLLECC